MKIRILDKSFLFPRTRFASKSSSLDFQTKVFSSQGLALLQRALHLIYSIFSRAPRCLPVRLAAIRPTLRPCGASRLMVEGLPMC